ncbi:hypothetical protein ACFPL7_00310 [Dongia soli]|uniref:Uncharacterized protein n=1 Tax=Dongia soli TaxID=600628 RepID=A0ABU5EEK0_9PROT|nr:hypothetical protein [Dongia soli]MDY0884449.1 hypothetical protein [Dongia soli]
MQRIKKQMRSYSPEKHPVSVMTAIGLSVLLAGISAAALPARAEQSAGALVEEIESGPAGVAQFDSLRAGQTVDLRPSGHAIISYLDNCRRETISGGLVKIGKTESVVEGGQVSRETVDCGTKQLALSGDSQDQSATVVFRPLPTVPSVSPFIIADRASKVTLTRTDKEMAPVVVALKKGRADLQAAGIKLQPGGVYQVTAGKRKTTIMIDPAAKPGETPLLRRLVKL